jgi:hypothetical protein
MKNKMKATKKEVENAVLFFAKKFGSENNYKAIMSSNTSLPRVVEMIIYDMFLNKFSVFHSTSEEYDNYKIIYNYAHELNKMGFVTFKSS